MTVQSATPVRPEEWVETVAGAQAEGFTFFEWLGCVDEIGRPGAEPELLRVLVVLRRLPSEGARSGSAGPEALGAEIKGPGVVIGPKVVMGLTVLVTELPRDRPQLASLGSLFAGAVWHEREAAEMFGVEFVGGDARRLLLGPEFEGTPMRKDEVLGARAGSPWPGAKEPGESAASPSRRRMAPPGVPDPAVWGDRDPAAEAAPAAEVAESAVGGRVRRRRP